MAIDARLDDAGPAAGSARQPRRTLRLETEGTAGNGEKANVRIHNVSTTGLLIETRIALAPGDPISVDLPRAGGTPARVVWASGHLFGCQFDMPVSRSALSAAQLRSAVWRDLETPLSGGQASVGDGDFPQRLQRLRKQAGLSLSQVATRLGVSKPTVWAWEQGKARPIEERLADLASVLGVPSRELSAGGDDPELRGVVQRCREEIAEAFGTTPERVRITIDL